MPSYKTVTVAAANRFKPPKTGQIDHFDRQYPGLSLRVSCGGRKSWTYHYRLGGKLKRMTFGTLSEMTVEQAHDAWREARKAVEAGRDPRPTAPTAATDFDSVFREWLQRDQSKNKSVRIVKRSIEREVLPSWGHREITDIGRRDVLDVIDAIADRGAVIAARRMQARLHRLFKWAVGRGIIEVNPAVNLPKPGEETKRDRVLTDDELVKVWNAAERLGYPYGPAFQLLILTGGRREEIGQLNWTGEIVDREISLAGDRTKNGEPHSIPLSTPARALLDQLPRIAGSDYVFTVGGRSPISGWSRAKVDLDDLAQVESWRTHDLRRTAATGLQRLKTPLQVTEAILGHTAGSRGGIVGVYQKYSYADEKRAALEAWGAHVMALLEKRKPGRVVAMRRG